MTDIHTETNVVYPEQFKAISADEHVLYVRKRNQAVVSFDMHKIARAILRSFLAVEGEEATASTRVRELVGKLTAEVVETFERRSAEGTVIDIETIQDQVELTLMRAGQQKVSRAYVLYREEHKQNRDVEPKMDEPQLNVTLADGSQQRLDREYLQEVINEACDGLTGVDPVRIFNETLKSLYNAIPEDKVIVAAMLSARMLVEHEPDYTFVTARLLHDQIRRQALGALDMNPVATFNEMSDLYPELFVRYVNKGIALGHLNPELTSIFDLEQLAETLDSRRDGIFTYLGMQTLFDRYLIHDNGVRYEMPQCMIMRVAMGLALQEDRPTYFAQQFYLMLSSQDYMTSTPTLFNSGTRRSQMSSCYLTTIPDHLEGIYTGITENAMLSKWAGGLGNDWTPVRALGSHIKGTNGKSQGIVPFLKVVNDTAVAVNQCFAPSTLIHTAQGVRRIDSVNQGDLVLGVQGNYRQITEVMSYDQQDPMVDINVKHSIEPIQVTAGHPFYVIRGQGSASVETALQEGTVSPEWIEAKDIQSGDYMAQVIPQEVVPVEGFTDEDAYQHGVTVGQNGEINSQYMHLPTAQTIVLVQGIMKDHIDDSDDQVITFTHTDRGVLDILRYQLLRLGMPTLGDAELGVLMVPAVKELAERLNRQVFTDYNWFIFNNCVYSHVRSVKDAPVQPLVYDLKVEGDESYMTTSGLAHNGGKRKGAVCAYLESWHLDIEEFLELRKNTGDDRRRTHDMNTANWIPDLFMERVHEDGHWTLFSPSDVPDLHDLYGQAFRERYEHYEQMADQGEIKHFKRLDAKTLWRKMLGMLFETGHPWLTWKDPANLRSPQQHAGVVHSSNLCTEITLNTSDDEIAVCNLGSVNLAAHIHNGQLDEAKLRDTVRLAVRALDNVIDVNYYAVEKARNSNLRHRPVGMGMMGFQDALYMLGIAYGSDEAITFADRSMELISYLAIEASSDLAAERGRYESYAGSLWSEGILPIDSIRLLAHTRKEGHLQQDTSITLDWDSLRAKVLQQGMRNSNVMAIAPTATISNICGVTQSIEPTYQNLYVKSNLSGEFTVINPHMVRDLKAAGLWDDVMINDLKYFDGSLQDIVRIPQHLKDLYATAFEVDPAFIVECASRRQKWIDQAQSLNLYVAGVSGKKLDEIYRLAWRSGLKTTYYLRAQASTRLEKSTLKGTDGKLTGVPTTPTPAPAPSTPSVTPSQPDVPASMKLCSIDNPDCEACQ